jgi:hypothetical protein
MNRRVAIVAICLLSLSVMLLGCDTGRPSDADIQQAVLEEIAGRTPVYGFEPEWNWVQEVKVIDVGRPYTIRTIIGDYTYWPVKVYMIGDGRSEETRVEIYKDEFGEWKAIVPY